MISITLDRCEIKENQEACESFVESINAMARDIFSEPDISLSDAESRVFEGFRLIRQKFLEMFLSHQANEEPSEPVDCPKCGQVCRLAACLDFREAAKELSYHGIKVSHETVHQLVASFQRG